MLVFVCDGCEKQADKVITVAVDVTTSGMRRRADGHACKDSDKDSDGRDCTARAVRNLAVKALQNNDPEVVRGGGTGGT